MRNFFPRLQVAVPGFFADDQKSGYRDPVLAWMRGFFEQG
jgi:hypothetical protein